MNWAAFIAFIKTFPKVVNLVQSFVDAWEQSRVIIITRTQDEREQEREAIIWAMEEARKIHDVEKLRALNRSLAALDGNKVLRPRPIQPPEGEKLYRS